MAQIYAIYLRSNPMVHDVVTTRRTAAEDFKQFVNPVPGSYVEGRTRANPALYADMNAVDFLVLQPPSSWSSQDLADPVASWKSRPTEVVDQIRTAVIQRMKPWEVQQRDWASTARLQELKCTDGREMQADYPLEIRKEFRALGNLPSFELYLTPDELLEVRQIYHYQAIRMGQDPDHIWAKRVTRLLAFHEQLRLQEGKS